MPSGLSCIQLHPVEAQIKTQNRRMVLKHEGALLVATESNLAKMMMMFITISARDQSSKGRRRILAFQQRRHEAVVGRRPTSDPGHERGAPLPKHHLPFLGLCLRPLWMQPHLFSVSCL